MEVHLGARMVDARRAGDRVRLMIAGRPEPAEADFLILGTGFQVDLSASPATASIAPHAATWADRHAPPPELKRAWRALHPTLGGGVALALGGPERGGGGEG